MAVTIDIISNAGVIKHTAVYEEGSVRKYELMKEDYVSLSFRTKDLVQLELGDYIQCEWGRFEITTPQRDITFDRNTLGYQYNIRFDADYWKLNNKLFKFATTAGTSTHNECAFALTDTLSSHLSVIQKNIEALGYRVNISGVSSVEGNGKHVYIQYDNCYIIDALTRICEAFDCEWWIDGSNGNWTINVGHCKHGTAVPFTIGDNVEEMSAVRGSEELVTRIYAFGGETNIPANYRSNDAPLLQNGVKQLRLALPSEHPYVDVVGNDGSAEKIVEGVVIFDDVFPRSDCYVTDVIENTVTVEGEDGNDEQVKIYRIKSSQSFSKDYILEGKTLQIQFTGGSLRGMLFEVRFNPDGLSESEDGAQVFEIIRNETYGLQLPNTTLKPALGDTFSLFGWDVTKMQDGLQLITAAENELLSRARQHAARLAIDTNVYQCTMMASYMYGLDSNGIQDSTQSRVGTFAVGQLIQMNNALFAGGSRVSRVVGYEYKLDIPYDGAVIYVGECATYSRNKASGSSSGSTVTYKGSDYSGGSSSGGGTSVYVITSNDNTVATDSNVYSAKRSDLNYPSKRSNDSVSALWTFNNGNGSRRGIRTADYDNPLNENNILGSGFELVEYSPSSGGRRTRLEVDELLVRMSAFFSKLELRELSYVGGNYLFSAAGSRITKVEWLDANGDVLEQTDANKSSIVTFRCYWLQDDGTTATMNYWEVGDQARCQTFNIKPGVYENVANKYYWRLVTGVGNDYVDLSYSDCDTGSAFPEEGDSLVQLGNRGNSARRKGAIYLDVESANSPAIYEYAGINSYVIPNPSITISPNGNVFYGEFHSVTNGQGSSTSINDQILGLLRDIEALQAQADGKFYIWYGYGVPTLNNYPASEWTDDTTKAEHLQDIYYDLNREAASDGGRAYRFELNNSTYGWTPINDADTLAALEKINDVASDGKLSGGAEKTRVYIEWMKAVDDYKKYYELADDYDQTTEMTALAIDFTALATLLNGNASPSSAILEGTTPPAWLADLETTTDISTYKTAYRTAWHNWYTSLAATMKAINEAAQAGITAANEAIANMSSDSKLDPAEKLTVKREFIACYHEMMDTDEDGYPSGILDKARAGNSYIIDEATYITPYINAFKAVAAILNNGEGWTIPALNNFSDNALPVWIRDANMGTTNDITGATWRNAWANFYSCRTAVLTALADNAYNVAVSKTGVFVGDAPTPPYIVGDLWLNNGVLYICKTARGSGNYNADDWTPFSDYVKANDPRIALTSLANKAYDYVGGTLSNLADNAYVSFYLGSAGSAGTGNMRYYNNTVSRYTNGAWSAISGNDGILYAFRTLYDLLGEHTLKVFGRVPSSVQPSLYDLVVRQISITDPVSADQITGGIEILMYGENGWETLQESVRGIIENLGNKIRSIVFGSDIGTVQTAGFVTTQNLVDIFATATDSQGRTITQAYLSAFVQKDANGEIQSGVSIGADQVTFAGKTIDLSAEQINFLGQTIINNKFIVDANGNVTMNNATMNDATIKGNIYTPYFDITDSNISSVSTSVYDSTWNITYYSIDLTKTGLNINIAITSGVVYIELPTDNKYLGAEANVYCSSTNYVVLRYIRRVVGTSSYESYNPMLYLGMKMKLKCVQIGSTNAWVADGFVDLHQPISPTIMAYCSVDVGYSNNQWNILVGAASDYCIIPGMFSVVRSGTGKYTVTIPSTWNGKYSLQGATIMAWGIGYVWEGTSKSSKYCKATVVEVNIDYTKFVIGTSDDDSANDGSFGFMIMSARTVNEFIV